ncbi:hypothetical protein [Bombilactobacillus bombi]|uniref:hypothetical protein n=1 Tax=Bombilactobacillus bombi TaxID=1303590 RepID=UPI0015E61EF9|nr:hypothetical protein [Bombilactobacillus bombi]MBA1434274.1 hypothetical protein [Bombilactobacillus bombi]
MALFKHGKKQQPQEQNQPPINQQQQPNNAANQQQQTNPQGNNFQQGTPSAPNQYFQDVPDYPVNDPSQQQPNPATPEQMPESNNSYQQPAPQQPNAPLTPPPMNANTGASQMTRPVNPAPTGSLASNNNVPTPPNQRPLSTQAPASVDHPYGSLENWEYTEKQLKDLETKQEELKSQLKIQLLSSRTFYSHLIQSKQSVHLDQSAIDLEVRKIQRINDTLRRWFGTDMISGDVFFDHNRKYFILQEDLLEADDNQRERLADLAYYLDDHNVLPSIITLIYDENIDARWQAYLDEGIINPESEMLNIYNYFQTGDIKAPQPLQGPNTGIEIGPQAHVESDQEHNIDRVYNGNTLVMKITKDLAGRPATINHYHDGEIISTDYLDEQGINRLTQVFNPKDPNKVMDEFFYRVDNSLAIVKSYVSGEPYIQVLNRSNIMVKSFDTEQEFIVWWLSEKALDDNSTLIVPLSSPVYQLLLEKTDLKFKVLPYVDNYETESQQLANILDNAEQLNLKEGILVNNEEAQRQISQSTQGKINVSIIPSPNKDNPSASEAEDTPAN